MITVPIHCTGCAACFNICPVGCIKMEQDKEGFLQPKIEASSCIKCGRCEAVCPILNDEKQPDNFSTPKVFAVRDKCEKNLEISSSGGLFGVLASYVISNGGVVFGAAFVDHGPKVSYQCALEICDLEKLRATKYVQSEVRDCFKTIKNYLQNNVTVLFAGTACHVAGLKRYLGKEYSNLITIDLICHGVPSPGVFQTYWEHMERHYGSKIKKYTFRTKNIPWSPFPLQTVETFDGKIYELRSDGRSFFTGFINNLYLRRSCYNCKFAKLPRVADFTIGDFWGIEEDKKLIFETNKGVSCVLLNNRKAEELFDQIKDDIYLKEEPLELVKRRNRRVVDGKQNVKGRQGFYKFYCRHTWKQTEIYINKIDKLNVAIGKIKKKILMLVR